MSRNTWRRQSINHGAALLISARGQTMPIAVVIVIVLVMIGVCAIGLVAIFGGSNELQNAVDSGNLNVATMSVVGPEVQLTPVQEDQFAGVAVQRSGHFYINLGNINRVWGQTMASVLNAQMMDRENGQRVFSPQAQRNVREIYSMATAISRELTSKLNQPSLDLSKAYKTLAGSNSLRMVGESDPTLIGENWNTAHYEQRQKKDSNVYINTSEQFAPGAIQLPTNLFNPNRGYMLGYEPFFLNDPLNGKYDFCFVPLSHEQRPFLVPLQKFGLSKTTDFLTPFSLAGVIPPNSFSYLSKADAPKTDAKLEKVAAGVAKDVTAGFPIQFPRGFIRIDNDPGANGSSLHVIDYLSAHVVTPKFNGTLGMQPSPVLAQTVFNPLQVKEGVKFLPSPYIMKWKGIDDLLLWTPFPFGPAGVRTKFSLIQLFIMLANPYTAAIAANLIKLGMLTIAMNVISPVIGPEIVGDPPKMAMGHTPAVSANPSQPMIRDGTTSGWFSVYASNADDNGLVFELESGDTSSLDLGILAGELVRPYFETQIVGNFLVPIDVDVALAWLFASGGWSDKLRFTLDDNTKSGMRERLSAPLPVPSLINRSNKKYTQDGSLKIFLGDRDRHSAVGPICEALKRRMRIIKPSASMQELKSILDDTTRLPLGCAAYIFLGDDGNLKVSVAQGTLYRYGAPIPSWLTKFMRTPPDAIGPWSEHIFQDSIAKSYYRLADPAVDFFPPTSGFSKKVCDDYPATAKNFDRYLFAPASGFNGLLGALTLQSGFKRACAMSSDNGQESGVIWEMPENCFIHDGMYKGRYGDDKR